MLNSESLSRVSYDMYHLWAHPTLIRESSIVNITYESTSTACNKCGHFSLVNVVSRPSYLEQKKILEEVPLDGYRNFPSFSTPRNSWKNLKSQ